LVDPEFLYYWLNTDIAQRRLRSLARQTTNISNLPPSEMARATIPLPPLKEQKRIAFILLQTSELGDYTTQLDQAAQQFIPSLFNEMFGSGHDGSRNRLDHFAEVVSGVAKGRSVIGGNRKVPYLRVANVQAGRLDLSEIKTIPATESEIEDLRLQPGDVLLTEGGDFDKLGRGAIWRGEIQDCIHQNHVFRVRPHAGKLDPVFLSAFLQSAAGRHYFLRAAKRTTNLASINMSQLRAMPLPSIPFAQQLEFRRRVEAFEAMMLEKKNLDFRSDELLASLNAFAFSGELTARWRERHRAELAAQASDRDAALRAAGAKLPVAPTPTIAERESRVGARKEGAYAELTPQQESLLEALEAMAQRAAQEAATSAGANPRAHAVFTPETIAKEKDAPERLRHQPDLIRRELEVLSARGLVLRVSRRRHREAYEPDAFGDLYRLPASLLPSTTFNTETGGLVPEENIRDTELAQMATRFGGRMPV
jgi:type I restriction enzyme S subunit